MRTNSAIPIVQQKRGALIYKYHCADLKKLHNYAKELEQKTVIPSNTFYKQNEFSQCRIPFFFHCTLAASYNV